MNQDPEKRHTSAEDELIDALEKLEATLESRDLPLSPKTPPKTTPIPSAPKKPKQKLLLSALEDAVADIDQFMAAKHQDQEPS